MSDNSNSKIMKWILTITMIAGLTCIPTINFTEAATVNLIAESNAVKLQIGNQSYEFTKDGSNTWAFDSVYVSGVKTAIATHNNDSFWIGSGRASDYEVIASSGNTREVKFHLGTNSFNIKVDSNDRLPIYHIALNGPGSATAIYRTVATDYAQHGAWVTRGYVATDADGYEAFIDSTNPLVFGHSNAGSVDAAYMFMAVVNNHIQGNGRTEQRADTYMKSGRIDTGGGYYGYWQLRMGSGEPKQYKVLFDRDLGGRFSNVCEKYYVDAVDTLVDIDTLPIDYDPYLGLEKQPLRFSAPDAYIPGWGWEMHEFPNASYPYATDSCLQIAAMLAYEGHATGRQWEKYFAEYLINHAPLIGGDNSSYFVNRSGGIIRWGYNTSYANPFPHLEGGAWWIDDVLYNASACMEHDYLKDAALDMVLHDINVKLDLGNKFFPPCWNAIENRVGDDHRDDWFKTPALAYCAYVASNIAYPETGNTWYIDMADQLCDWFAGYMANEYKLNFLQGNNMHATVFSQYIPLAFLDKYERSGDVRFLEMAKDSLWVIIMTMGTTTANDSYGRHMAAVTCVGVRGCVDYDCSPNLCHEKDMFFYYTTGRFLDHFTGPAYAKYILMQKIVLKRDGWNDAWSAEMRDTNHRTMYDAYARGMTNLTFAINKSSDPRVPAFEKLASKHDLNITHQRDMVLANGTTQNRNTTVQVNYLKTGLYELIIDNVSQGNRTDGELASGFQVFVPANTLKHIQINNISLTTINPPTYSYDTSVTYLSDLQPYDAQRDRGLPQPIYRNDRSFNDNIITIGGQQYGKGLGCTANTVIVYDLGGQYETFSCRVGIDNEVAGTSNPNPSVFITVFADGRLKYENGTMYKDTPPNDVSVDVRHVKKLVLRVADNWDDNGNDWNDHCDWADAKLIGKAIPLCAPENVTVIVSDGEPISVQLNWQDMSGSGGQCQTNENGYIIERRPWHGQDNWHEITTLPPDTTSYTDTTSLHGLTAYTYRIGAYTDY